MHPSPAIAIYLRRSSRPRADARTADEATGDVDGPPSSIREQADLDDVVTKTSSDVLGVPPVYFGREFLVPGAPRLGLVISPCGEAEVSQFAGLLPRAQPRSVDVQTGTSVKVRSGVKPLTLMMVGPSRSTRVQIPLAEVKRAGLRVMPLLRRSREVRIPSESPEMVVEVMSSRRPP